MPMGTLNSTDAMDPVTAVKGLAVLTAIPVVIYALWTDYFGRFVQERLQEDPKLDLAPEVARIRVAGFFAFLSQFMLFTSSSEVRQVYPVACNLLFVAALGFQMWIQSSTERKLAPPSSAKGRDPFLLAMRAFLWSTLGGIFYIGLLIASLKAATWVSVRLQLSPDAGAALLAVGAVVGVFGGLALGFALGPFQMRRMFPCTNLSDPELAREIGECFTRSGLKSPSLWVIGTDELRFANAMIAGFKSGRGPFRPALFVSQPLLDGLDRAELRAVILHEISHLRLQHLRRRMVLSSGMILAASIATGFALLAVHLLMPAGPLNWLIGLGALAGAFAVTLRLLAKQNRFQEIEADIHSIRLGAGMENLISALRKLDRINNPDSATLPASRRLLAGTGHPMTEERIKIIRAYFQRHPNQLREPEPIPNPESPDGERKAA